MKDVARQVVAKSVDQMISGKGWSEGTQVGSSCVIGSVPIGSPPYAQLTGGRTPRSGRRPIGLLVKESMRRHPDSLSVTGGIWQRSTESEAPSQEWAWIVADGEGHADVDYLCRDGGKAEKLLAGMI